MQVCLKYCQTKDDKANSVFNPPIVLSFCRGHDLHQLSIADVMYMFDILGLSI